MASDPTWPQLIAQVAEVVAIGGVMVGMFAWPIIVGEAIAGRIEAGTKVKKMNARSRLVRTRARLQEAENAALTTPGGEDAEA